jgi:hypothetical protein
MRRFAGFITMLFLVFSFTIGLSAQENMMKRQSNEMMSKQVGTTKKVKANKRTKHRKAYKRYKAKNRAKRSSIR